MIELQGQTNRINIHKGGIRGLLTHLKKPAYYTPSGQKAVPLGTEDRVGHDSTFYYISKIPCLFSFCTHTNLQ